MTTSVLVVGGGVIGTSVAWHLAQRDAIQVKLIERDRLGSGTTWHSAGNITWKMTPDSDAPIDYMLDLVERLHRETGQDTGWRYTGRLFLARTESYLESLRGYADAAQRRGYGGSLMAASEVDRFHPLASPDYVTGGWINPRSGHLNPADLVAAYAKGARQGGVEIVENCTVKRVLLEGDTAVGVETSQGAMYADYTVVCTGLWSRLLLEPSNVYLGCGACEHFYVIANTAPALARGTPSFICPESLIYGREEVGGFLVGFFDRDAKLIDVETLPEPFTFTLLPDDWDKIATYYQSATELFPVLKDAPIRRFINGPESFSMDGNPLVGPLNRPQGLYVACGLNSAGVTFSGVVGHTIADLLSGVPPRFAEINMDPNRFGDEVHDRAVVDDAMPGAPSRFYSLHMEA